MAFPYLAPIKPWIVNVLEEREEDKGRNLKTLSSPFIVLTSGAKVIKSTPEPDESKRLEKLKQILSGNAADYHGCIITNQSKPELLYQTAETIIGYDFKGKAIKVDGETNRRISTPIIESLEIDTDGANNTLKTARLIIKCFSLKQLEMFELFFLKPGMNLLVEYGDNSLDRRNLVAENNQSQIPEYERILRSGKISEGKSFNKIADALIDKRNYDAFITGFSEYYRADTDAIAKYLQKAEQTLGTYDLVAGKVTQFNFEIDESGVYTVTLEISQGNQLTLAIPLKQKAGQNTNTSSPLSAGTPTYEQYLESISVDLNLPQLKKELAPEDIWKNHLFNWGKLNEKQSDTSASNKPYISLHFIVEILMNYIVDDNNNLDKKFFRFDIPTYYTDEKLTSPIKCIPIHYHQYMISSTEDIIFPNKTLPNIVAPKGSSTKLVWNPQGSKFADGSIGTGDNKLELMLKQNQKAIDTLYTASGVKITLPVQPTVQTPTDNVSDIKFGNAANIFINYLKVVEIWNKSGTRRDFLLKVLDLINEASLGFYTLVFGSPAERVSPSIMDMRMGQFGLQIPAKGKIYRFKPGTIKSNVRSFSFNFELSNLVAGRTVFNSQTFLMAAIKKNPQADIKSLPLPPEAYKSIDFSMYANADGYYSINQIDYLAINETWKKTTQKPTESVKPNEEKKENEADNLSELLKAKSVKFKKPEGNVTLIFKDDGFVRDSLNQTIKPKSTLAPIEVTLEIDGISGLSCGEYFEIDGVPEIYNQTGVFQITNTKHNIDNDGWKTTIEAAYRIVKK